MGARGLGRRQEELSSALSLQLGDRQSPAISDLLRRASGTGAPPWDVIRTWLELKPPFANWFLKGEQATLASGSGRTLITGFQIPAGCYGVLRFFSQGVQNAGDSPNVRFSLERDGTPLIGFARIVGPLTPALNQPRPMMDPLLTGQIIAIMATNTGSGTVAGVAGYLCGWFWPVSG